MRQLILFGLVTSTALLGCTQTEIEDRPEPPLLQVLSPERGTMTPGLATVEVRGTVMPAPDSDATITRVEVNGMAARLDELGNWSANITLEPGANVIRTVATDSAGAVADDTRGLVTGDLRPVDTTIENAIAAGLSAAAFDKLGDTAASLVSQSDLGAFVAPYNPVIAKGLDNGEEDCLYGKVSVKPGLDVANAFLALVPNDSGLALDAELVGVNIPLHARYAAACLDGDTDITITAQRARIRGNLAITVVNGRFDVRLVNPTVTFTGFMLDAGGVPGAVLDLLDLDQEIADTLAWAVERFMAPLVNRALSGVEVGPQNLSLLGQQLRVAVAPAGVAFDAAGAEVVLDGSLVVQGTSAKFVYTENQTPPGRGGAGVALAVADDTINQLLAGFWGAGGLNMQMEKDLGMFDSLRLDALLPPVVSTDADGAMKLVMTDLMLELRKNGQMLARTAVTMEMKLKVEPAASTYAAKIAIELPTLRADILENVQGIPDEQLEALLPHAVESQIATFAPLLGAVPLPTVQGVIVTDLHMGGTGGYVTIAADIQ
ncbi:MAG: hypothetical protein K8M05_30720 [Deltaproteobacteria bacterium]|nr:hypothetical protein [Kofleriaceae bacterium]